MYLLITTSKYKGKIYKSAKVAESYKTSDGKSRQKIVQSLGPVKNGEDEKRFRKIVAEMNLGKKFVDFNSLKIKSAKNYGVFYVVENLLKRYDIKNILQKNLSKTGHRFNAYEILQSLIVNRLENPQSKNKAYEYIKKDYPKKINCKKDDLYSTMDILYDNKENIELEIFNMLKKKLNLNTEKVLYDITSSYFEGHKCEIALHGYSRDHRGDREQIVIGLVLVDGIPVYHKVFEGNKQDKTTVIGIVDYLRDKFNLTNAIFIGDRGMLTEKNLQNLETKKQKFILGFSKDGNKITEELLQKDVPIKNKELQGAILAKTATIKHSKKDSNEFTRKYILCLNKNTRKEQLETINKVKDYIDEKLTELINRYRKSQKNKGKKISYESLVLQARKIISRNKQLYKLTWQTKDKDIQGFEFKLNNDWYERERKAAGKFVIITNTEDVPIKILENYKSLSIIEKGFDYVKNQLDARPINHYKECRVKAHIFICMLALLAEKIMERIAKDMTAQVMIEELKRIRCCDLGCDDSDKKIITELSLGQKLVLDKLDVVVG